MTEKVRVRKGLGLIVCILLLALMLPATQAHAEGTEPATRTPEQINQFFLEHPFDISRSVEYTSEPSTVQPYATGDISDTDRQEALNALNLVRYVAGLSSNVQLEDEYNRMAQASSLVNSPTTCWA